MKNTLAVLTALTLVGACGGGGDDDSGSLKARDDAEETAGEDAEALDACALLTAADAEAILGEPVTSRDGDPFNVPGVVSVSICGFDAADGKGGFVKLSTSDHRGVPGAGGEGSAVGVLGVNRDTAESHDGTVEDVSGLGDQAIFAKYVFGNVEDHELTVVKGPFVVHLASDALTLENGRPLAERILGNLPT